MAFGPRFTCGTKGALGGNGRQVATGHLPEWERARAWTATGHEADGTGWFSAASWEIKAQAALGKDEAATGWQSMKDNWHSHVADLHNGAGKKAETDRRKAEAKAEAAEDYAARATGFAAAVQEGRKNEC